ncbi:Non-specific serine/threonine protein kinase [Luteimicrobium xylanilyticum]|uniref:Non-specific serine/threonine protein kinase n=1 Tax=Luteimicrobium xylanilyticum TaxID=1133546 RepID=A0A5P9Q6Q1_9MICO|nr:Non-specific serine/threonine protein kinase [Luteimicrobium xylanilyticum]
MPRRLWVPRDRTAPAPHPPGFAQSLPIPDGAVTLPAVMRRIAGLPAITTTTLTEETVIVERVEAVVEETVVPALLLAPPRAPVAPPPVPPAPPAPPVPPAHERWSPPPAPPSSAPARTPGARPWRRRRPRLRLALLLLLATLVAAGVLLVSRGDGITPAPAPTALTAANVTFDGADVHWQPTGDRATAYLVRVATDPALRHVVWTRTVDAADPRVHVGGRGITEDEQLYVTVTSTWHGVAGSTTQPLAVHTPLRPPSPVTDVTTKPDTSGVTLTWGAAARATGYQVVVASDAAMTKVLHTSAVVHGTKYRVSLRDGARYHVLLRTVRGPAHASEDGDEQVVRGPDSRVRAFSTPLKRLGVPTTPTVHPLSASTVKVSWKPVTNATRYTVTFAATAKSKQRTVLTTTHTSVTLDGVRPKAMHLRPIFYVRVVADRWGLVEHTSKPRTATVLAGNARTPVAFTTTVATYNLLRTQFDDDAGRSWAKRFTLSGKQLRGVGIAGLQETGWGKVDGKRPVSVVAKAAHLKVAKHPHSSTPCTTQNQPVLYASGKFSLLHCGYAKVSAKSTKGIDARYATWVELKNKKSRQTVLVVNAHLTAYTSKHSSTSAVAQRARAAEAKRLVKLIAKHRRGGQPVVLTGDYNSYPGRWATTPLDVLAAAGYTSADLTARSSTDGDYASFHDFDGARANDKPIDHVIMNGKVVATSYRVHVTDSKKAPSDHYEVSAVVQVHRSH